LLGVNYTICIWIWRNK